MEVINLKFSQDDIDYSLNELEKTANLVKCRSKKSKIIIPRSIIFNTQEYVIKSISKHAFCFSKNKTIQFADNSEIHTIESESFRNSSIESISIPSSVIELKKGWCLETEKLIKISVSPNNPRYSTYEDKYIIGKSNLEQNNYDVLVFSVRNIRKVIIPDFIKIIGPFAFNKCNCIVDFKLPPQIQKICSNAFHLCVLMRNFEIPENSELKTIEKNAFKHSIIKELFIPSSVELNDGWCSGINLKHFSIDPKNKRYKIYENNFIIGKSNIESDDYDVLVFCVRNIRKVIIPNFIKIIASSAFNCCSNIKQIEFQKDSKLKRIEKEAFVGTKFNSISIPSSVEYIGKNAFACRLENIEFENDSKLQIIDKNAFYYSSIKNFDVPENVTQINEKAFYNCEKLENINIHMNSKLRLIGENAFHKTLIKSITIPSNLIELKKDWCSNTPKLTEIIISPNNPRYSLYKDEMIIGKSSIESENYDVLVFAKRNIEKLTIPAFIKRIEPHSIEQIPIIEFQANSELQIIENDTFIDSKIECIVLSPRITQIDEYAFYNCRYLKHVEIPKNANLKKIGFNAFLNSSIISITIPSKLTLIGECAFNGCRSFQQIEIPLNSELQTIEKDAFCNSEIKNIMIPSKLINLKDGWCADTSKLNKISVDPNNPRYSVYEGKFIIGKSNIEQENFDVLVFCVRDLIEEVKIPDFIKVIDKYAFQYTCIEKVIISPHLTKICEYAFSGCRNLRNIEIPENTELKIIEKYAFHNSSIESISIPPHLTKICECTFSECRNLRTIEIPENSELKIIEDYAFCKSSIESISIPPHLTEIHSYAFSKCEKLVHCIIPSNSELKMIEKYAFEYSSIETIFIPPHLTQIDENVFRLCSNLKKVEIPKNSQLQKIENDAFYGTSIESLFIPANVVELKEGWCHFADKLNYIDIDPNNQQYLVIENILVVGKSSPEQEIFDVLVFCVRDIESIEIPDFISIFGPYAFYNCGQLDYVELSPNVEKICNNAFSFCKNLSYVLFPEDSHLKIIEEQAFEYSSIQYISLPPHLTKISSSAFYRCRYLEYVDIPNNSELEVIGSFAFSESSINRISIPLHLTEICLKAFYKCKYLKFVDIPMNSELRIISDDAFNECSIEKFVIPRHIKCINEGVFFKCENLRTIVIPPDSELEKIDIDSFRRTAIESISFPPHVSEIFEFAFQNCTKLKIIELNEIIDLESLKESFVTTKGYDCLLMIPINNKYNRF